MDYNEAYDYLMNKIDGIEADKILYFIGSDDTEEGIKYIQKITHCSLNDAKLLWVDLKCQMGNDIKELFTITPQKKAELEAEKRAEVNKPKCITCGSTNIRKMGTVERGASIVTFGVFSKKINKTFKCNNCGMTW